MKTLLITAFDPFGGEAVNAAWEAACALPDQIGEWRIDKLQLPTVFGKAFEKARAYAEKISPQMIIALGQAAGRNQVTPEMVAINWRYARIADNDGAEPRDERIIPDGPDAYFTRLPVRRMEKAIAAAGVPGAVSYSAGAYVCNDLMYSLAHHYRDSGTITGFIHVPLLPCHAREGQPAMPLEDIVKALEAAILALDQE
ncbi:MAG: pyroglutamyl-peptidase I [Clostridiales bacterium]|nr:pyroglutamyl-peptidase I [Clostridiales bacterium]